MESWTALRNWQPWLLTKNPPSTTTRKTLISLANKTALRAAKASTITIEPGNLIFWLNAPIINPAESLTTTPNPAQAWSSKLASSKLTLYTLSASRDHLTTSLGTGWREGCFCTSRNSFIWILIILFKEKKKKQRLLARTIVSHITII